MARIIVNYPHSATAGMMAQMLTESFPNLQAVAKQDGLLSYTQLSFSTFSGGTELLIYNHEKGLANATAPASLLKLNRILYTRNNNWYRRYRVHMVNHHVVSLARQNLVDPATGKPIPSSRRDDNPFVPIDPEEREASKVVTLANRCLYILGLDIGMVKVGVDSLYRLHVTDIDPGPALTKKTMQRYIKILLKDINAQLAIDRTGLIMGTDPEFMLANTKSGALVPASYFFPRQGEVGCDNIRLPNRKHRPVAEFRPYPASTPAGLMENLKKAMQRAGRLAPYRNLKWVAGVMPLGFPIGGHVHFSGIPLSNHLLRALDNYLALPLVLLEPDKLGKDRRKKYGLLGEYRIKSHGGFEYRTPGSWLVDPAITLGALCLSYLVATNYPRLPGTFLMAAEAQERFYAGDRSYLRPLFDEAWRHIQALPAYYEYSNALEALASIISKGEPWDESADIRKNWGLPIGQLAYKEESNTKSTPIFNSRGR